MVHRNNERSVVHFRNGIDAKNCGTCAQFYYFREGCKLGRCGRCHVLGGCVYAYDLCDLWEPPSSDSRTVPAG